jgi:5-methylcytosine-specific restriction endonuclease McrA
MRTTICETCRKPLKSYEARFCNRCRRLAKPPKPKLKKLKTEICSVCGEEFKTYNSNTCLRCKRRARENRQSRAIVICVNCGKPFRTLNNVICQACRPHRNKLAKWHYLIKLEPDCVYCGKPATTVDHVWPTSRGGPDIESNLVPACRSCNCRKNDRLLSEWNDLTRLEYGLGHSVKVRAEYARLAVIKSLPLMGSLWSIDG